MSGKSYQYAQTARRYRLWSVGWDQQDDDGHGLKAEEQARKTPRDWVWGYPEQ